MSNQQAGMPQYCVNKSESAISQWPNTPPLQNRSFGTSTAPR